MTKSSRSNRPAELRARPDLSYLEANEMADALHRSLLPEQLPSLAGVRIAARYRPGGGGMVGGDWYDAFLLADGRLAIVVGDVAGHGTHAAAAMGQLRNALRAYVIDDPSPGRSLARLNALVLQLLPTEMATAIVAIVSADSRSVDVAMAGHLPPLLVVDGSARYVDVGRMPALGLAAPASGGDIPSARTIVPPAGVLLFFTDGLVEERGESIDEGLDRLRSLAAAGSPDPEELCEHVLSLVSDDPDADDVAVLAMQVA